MANELLIDQEIKQLIPPLTEEEFSELSSSIISYGCRDPLVVWDGTLLDGHHRLKVCTDNFIDYKVVEMQFDSREDALIWVVRNQFGRRNITAYTRGVLALRLKDFIAAKAKENQRLGHRSFEDKGCQNSDNPSIDTKKEIAKSAGVSHDTISRIEKIEQKASEEVKQKLMRGDNDVSINKVYSEIRSVEKREELVESLTNIEAIEAKALEGVYDVIVLDPPWDVGWINRSVRPNQVGLEYPTMSEAELEELVIPCALDCHVFCWTTHRHLPVAFRLLEKWGFTYSFTMVWHKPGGFQVVGMPQGNCEFAVYARKGTPKFIDTKAFNMCFEAPRGAHSEKPEEFYDVIRRVTAGRRLDMFNRRPIDGFDGWGKEA